MLAHKPLRVLLPRLDNLGDIVIVQGFLRALEDMWPDAELHLLVRRRFRDLESLCSSRLRWHATQLDGYAQEARPLHASDDVWPLVDTPWDLCLFTTFNRTWIDRSLEVALSARGVECVSLGVKASAEGPGVQVVEVDEWSHETEKYRRLLGALGGVEASMLAPRLAVPSDARASTRKFLAENSLPEGSFVLCVPGGTSNVTIKAWPGERFAACLRTLEQEHGLRSVVVGHRAEAALVGAVAEQARVRGASPVVWIGEDGSLPFLAGLTAAARLYLGTDTGPMHMASALATAVVAVFGGGHWARFTPSGGAVVCVAPFPCFRCQWTCMFGDAPCVRLIGVREVEEALREALQTRPLPAVIIRESTSAQEQLQERVVAEMRTLQAALREVRADQLAKAEAIEYLLRQVAEERSRVADYRALGWGLAGKVMTAKGLLRRALRQKTAARAVPPPRTRRRPSARQASGCTEVALDVLPIVFGVSGGVEVYMKTLVHALARERRRVRVTLLCHAGQSGPLRRAFGDEVSYRVLDRRGNGRGPAEFPFAGLSESVDVLHSPVQIFSGDDFEVPGVLNLHDLQHLHFPENFSRVERDARSALYGRSAARASAIIASSDFVRADIVERMGMPSSKVHTIPVACNPEIEEGGRTFAPADAKATYGLPEVFGFYPAQFWIHKNHARLIEAVRIVRERAPGWDLKLVLSGYRGHSGWPAAEKALDRHGMRDHVLLLDFIPTAHLAAIYRRATFCVVPSLFEASSYPVIEAQTLGCPAMCSAVTSLPELMADGAGLLFDPLSPEDMAQKMMRWLDDPEDRRAHAERGRQRANRHHSLEAYAGRILALYDSLVG